MTHTGSASHRNLAAEAVFRAIEEAVNTQTPMGTADRAAVKWQHPQDQPHRTPADNGCVPGPLWRQGQPGYCLNGVQTQVMPGGDIPRLWSLWRAGMGLSGEQAAMMVQGFAADSAVADALLDCGASEQLAQMQIIRDGRADLTDLLANIQAVQDVAVSARPGQFTTRPVEVADTWVIAPKADPAFDIQATMPFTWVLTAWDRLWERSDQANTRARITRNPTLREDNTRSAMLLVRWAAFIGLDQDHALVTQTMRYSRDIRRALWRVWDGEDPAAAAVSLTPALHGVGSALLAMPDDMPVPVMP